MLVDFQHRINVNAEFQRAPVWSSPQKALLIDSILRDFDIPKIILRKHSDGIHFLFDVIDGKQRLTAIWEFFSDRFAIPRAAEEYPNLGNLGGRRWSDLPISAQDKLQFSNITVSRIDDVHGDEVRELFLRLQRGEPLNAAEKRNAMKGPVRDFVAERLAKHRLWESTGIRAVRFGREEHAAILLLIARNDGPVSLKSADLSELYEDSRFDPDGTAARTVLGLLDVLDRVSSCSPGLIRTRWGLVDLSISLLRLSRKAPFQAYRAAMEFFIDFEKLRRKVGAILSDLQASLVDELRTEDDLSAVRGELPDLPADMLTYHMAFAREGASGENVLIRSNIMHRRLVHYLDTRS